VFESSSSAITTSELTIIVVTLPKDCFLRRDHPRADRDVRMSHDSAATLEKASQVVRMAR
jgi:hypothetical protein